MIIHLPMVCDLQLALAELDDVDDMVRKSHGRDREDIALASLRWQRV
jgi:hypothetical protein